MFGTPRVYLAGTITDSAQRVLSAPRGLLKRVSRLAEEATVKEHRASAGYAPSRADHRGTDFIHDFHFAFWSESAEIAVRPLPALAGTAPPCLLS